MFTILRNFRTKNVLAAFLNVNHGINASILTKSQVMSYLDMTYKAYVFEANAIYYNRAVLKNDCTEFDKSVKTLCVTCIS